MNKKQNFDKLINEIEGINNNLIGWLGDDCFVNSDDVLPKVLSLKSIRINNSDFFDDAEISELISFDNKLTNDLKAISFEKDVLLKKKNLALKELDISKAIMYVKLIDDASKRIDDINLEIQKVEKVFNEKHEESVKLYDQFVSDVLTRRIKEEEECNVIYNKKIVNRYRINKITDLIIANVGKNDYYDLFENQEVKGLLGNCYFQIKQKVNKYVGANS